MRELLEFNFLPTRYVHFSWLKNIPNGELLMKIRTDRQIEYTLSQHILTHYKLKDKYVFNLPDDVKDIAFLSGQDLSKLVVYLGVSLNVNNLRCLIDKHSIHDVKSVIGEKAFTFGVKRAPYLSGVNPIPKKPELNGRLGEYIIASGSYYLLSMLSQYETAISKRIIWKLPYQWVKHLAHQASSSHITKASLPLNDIFTEIRNYE